MRSVPPAARRMLLFSSVLLAGLAPASPSPDPKPKPGTLVQREEVRFVSLDLVVEDRRGGSWHRTTDLAQSQLRLLVAGKEIPLDSFERFCPSAPPAPAKARKSKKASADSGDRPADTQSEMAADDDAEPPEIRRFILYFDLENLTNAGRVNAFRAAQEWAGTSVNPKDEVMLVTGGLSLRIARPLLPASQHLQEDIVAAMEDFSGVDMWADKEQDRMEEIRLAWREDPSGMDADVLAGGYAHIDNENANRSLESMRQVMAMYESIPGIKNLILFTETLRLVPGSNYLTLGSSIIARRPYPDVTEPMQRLAREASDKNVRIYAVQAGGLDKDVEDPMTYLSTETGGAHIELTNRLASVFDRASADLQCFYRIGFRLPARKSGETERLWVRIPKNEALYRLRYRRTLDDPTQEQRDEASVRAAFLTPAAARGFPLGMGVNQLKREARGARFRVQILVPVEGLVSFPGPDPGHREVQLEIGGQIVPLNSTAAISSMLEDADIWADVQISRKTLGFGRRATLRIPPLPAAGTMRGRRAAFYTREFLAPPGRYRLVVVATDLNAHTVAAAVTDFDSSAPLAPLAGVSLAFEGRDLISLPSEDLARESKESKNSKEGKKEKWNGKNLESATPEIPSTLCLAASPGIGADRTLWAVYEVCRPGSGDSSPAKHASATGSQDWKLDRILDCVGKRLELPALALTPPAGETPCIMVPEKVPASDLPRGSCRLSVVLTQNGTVHPPKDLYFTVFPGSSVPAPAKIP